jgi:hypothetical protein
VGVERVERLLVEGWASRIDTLIAKKEVSVSVTLSGLLRERSKIDVAKVHRIEIEVARVLHVSIIE